MTARLFAFVAACAFLLAGSLVADSPAFAAEMPQGSAALFGVPEYQYSDISTFYKWTGALARFNEQPTPALWRRHDDKLRALPLAEMAARVNRVINAYAYISDKDNAGSQVWKTPQDFFAQGGGSCQDFAIAKYLWLEHLGVPADALRLAIVYDKHQREPHAITLVYDRTAILVLDNQDKRIRDSRAVTRYAPIYSINRQAWWRQSGEGILVDATGNVMAQESARHELLAVAGH